MITRRSLLGMIGTAAGSAAMYPAMTAMGHAQPSSYTGPIRLDGDAGGARVLVLGAGLAGMTAALELRAAGYEVEVLEYREEAGGRCWTLRSGDTYTELGGTTQNVAFAEGNYINPGPWRIPHHHHALLDYCKRLACSSSPSFRRTTTPTCIARAHSAVSPGASATSPRTIADTPPSCWRRRWIRASSMTW